MGARRRALLLWLLIAGVPLPAAARQADVPVAEGPRRVIARRVPNDTIVLDGRLSEPAWRQAIPATDFVQQVPHEGALSTEPTEVWFLYDDDNLYVGGMLHDSEPDKLMTAELQRDFGPRESDIITIVFDTFQDRLNSTHFSTNPLGATRDTQGADGGRSTNVDWDGVWDVRTAVLEDGWSAEFRIPFKTLRFRDVDEQVWGLQIMRRIRRKNETTMWNPVPRQYNQYRVQYAGVLEGIQGVRPGRNLYVKPFATSLVSRGRDTDWDGGMDLKMGIGPSLVLDATYRTDFSQVEVDEQQVNLTRFSLFFPEKREFFLENQGAFQFGPAGGGRNNLVPFFSRTIGLSEAGEPIPIVGGVRLSGKVGRNIVAALNMQTERERVPGTPEAPASNFTVVRYGREFLRSSSASAFYMGREQGPLSNRIGGVDLKLNPLPTLNLDALIMQSEKTGVGTGTAWRTNVDYNSTLSQYTVSYTSLGERFRNDLGFIPRQGVDIFNASVNRRLRPGNPNGLIREYTPEISYDRFTRPGVGVETEVIGATFAVDFADGGTANAGYTVNKETLDAPFRIRPGYAIPVGHHRFDEVEVGVTTSQARRVAVNGAYEMGGFWTGDRRGFTAGGNVRWSAKLNTSVNFSRNMVDLPGLRFDTNLVSLRLDGSFTTRMFLNGFFQYNSVNETLQSNVRFNVMHRPLSDIFVVYNETRYTSGGLPPERVLALKLTYLVSF